MLFRSILILVICGMITGGCLHTDVDYKKIRDMEKEQIEYFEE